MNGPLALYFLWVFGIIFFWGGGGGVGWLIKKSELTVAKPKYSTVFVKHGKTWQMSTAFCLQSIESQPFDNIKHLNRTLPV